jgi:glyoxylase-like metal-dependent hydrolase (beta-lactamase superfamily II)
MSLVAGRPVADWKYTRGLHDLGSGCYAYLQPDGSWGWSNAGLISADGCSLLVDTLFDLRLTRTMLDTMADVTARAPIKTLVNTHANGDHCWGNQLLKDGEIIASRACRDEMMEFQPSMLKAFVEADGLGVLGDYARDCFGAFEFDGISLTPPTRVFEGTTSVAVGGKTVELVEVGPAHTLGDVLVFVPADKTVFTGDILFIDGTPIMWAGPVANWIAACDRILAADVETIVPGHGPITDKAGVERVRSYLSYVRDEARVRFDAGMPVADAAKDISTGDFSGWGEKERIAVNVDTLYREFGGQPERADTIRLFGLMAELSATLTPAR